MKPNVDTKVSDDNSNHIVSQILKRPKTVIFGLKVVIFNFKMATQFSENIFIWTVAINWISNHGLIHFTISFFTFLSLLYQKGLIMVVFGLKMAI